MKNKVYQEAIDIHTTVENGTGDPAPDLTKPMTAGDLFEHSKGELDPHWANSILYGPGTGEEEYTKVSDVLEQHSAELQTKLEAGNIKAGSNVTVTTNGDDVTISSDSNGPKNAKFVYCDGSDDHLKIQAAIDEVTDTSIPTVIYPVGECVLKVIARGVPEGIYQPINLITLGDNMTLDGKYCKIILDFTAPFTETEGWQNGFVTIFMLGNNSGLMNCDISARGDNLCHHRLVTCYAAQVGPNAAPTTGTKFVNNKVSGITVKLDTLNAAAFGYIYLVDSIIANNQFKNLDCTHCGAFIYSNGTISQNMFESITLGGYLIQTGGKYVIDNRFENITEGSSGLVEVTGMYTNISGNVWGNIHMFGGNVLCVSGRATVMNNAIINLTVQENSKINELYGIYITSNSVVFGNKIYFPASVSGESYTKVPLLIEGNYNFVMGNITNYTSIGEVTGTGNIQRDNIATGQITD